jgi:FkbM family methyltransferase
MKKISLKCYLFLKSVFGGYGLRRLKPVKVIVLRFEKFLKGNNPYLDYKGLRFFLDRREQLATITGSYEPETTAYVETHLKQTDRFVDVGSAIGWFALIASKLCSKVTAFEPNPVELPILQKNVAYNKAYVDIIPMAAGRKEETKTFYTFSDFHAASTFYDPGQHSAESREASLLASDDHSIHQYQVKVVPIDNVVGGAEMMKIDVEQFEMEVLKGMTRILKECKPTLIIETNNPEVDTYLAPFGYHRTATFDGMNQLYR